MVKKYLAILKLFLISPRLFFLAIKIRKTRKTYLGYGRLLSLTKNFYRIRKKSNQEIHIAEFGVGRGGSAMLLAWLANSYGGRLTLFDVFGRIPSPTEKDGEVALKRYESILNQEKKDYYGNLPDLLDLVKIDIGSLISLDRVNFVVGKYEETLPEIQIKNKFHLIHIDCDWYESTNAVLSFLETKIYPNSIIQFDDYLHWPGTQKAVRETQWLHGYHSYIIEGALVIDMGQPQPGKTITHS